jgi:hypothetical protein
MRALVNPVGLEAAEKSLGISVPLGKDLLRVGAGAKVDRDGLKVDL